MDAIATPAQHPLAPVVGVAGALVDAGAARVRALAGGLAARGAPFDPAAVVELALPGLHESLIALLGRPVALELQVARLLGPLAGDTPNARFRTFAASLTADPEDFWAEYPVLASQVELCVEHWVRATAELLRRLCEDFGDIRATLLAGEDPGRLASLDCGAGDRHRQGRSVVVAGFESGAKVVYKPRSLAVDVHFQDLLRWLDARGDHPPFRTLRIVDRGSHGWVEFVRTEGCSTREGVRRFYRRQGGYLALLHVLCAVDFHHENLVAAGEHPVLVDVESLFHPELFDHGPTAEAALRSSVLAVGLLPYRVVPDGKAEGIDVSGLGAVEGALWPGELPRWERAGTDEMRMAKARVSITTGSHHRPLLNGAAPDVADHAGDVATGFSAIYELCRVHCDELLARGGPIARFAADEVRVIVRPTQTYAALLQASRHPDVLRSAADRRALIAKLRGQVEAFPVLGRLVGAEEADVWDGDIPLFTARPGARDLWTSRGERLEAVLPASGLALAAERLRGLGAADLARQRWFVDASFASLAPSTLPGAPARMAAPGTAPTPERLLALASAAGDRLAASACRGDGASWWIALALSAEGRWTPAPLDSTLYGGLAGVTLFLAQLGAMTGEERHVVLAREALAAWRLRRELDLGADVGALTGWGGALYMLARLAALWEDAALVAEAREIAERLPALIERDEVFDLYGGAAGCIMGLLALHAVDPAPRTLELAAAAGDRLLAGARRMEPGLGWVSPRVGDVPLSGLSHGASGIAMALAELASASGDERYRLAAHAALAHERSLFDAEVGNWADLRPVPPGAPASTGPRFMTAVCHGAPGVALARLRLLRHGHDRALERELDAAVQATLRYAWGANHSLCHGDLGNLEVLREASLATGRWTDEVARASAAVVADVERRGFHCATPDAIESPELMTGLAGIGYALLRLAAPAVVPSVLALCPAGGP
jgi:type 2 lantibiotic biosynthesis protein LanM